MSNVLGLWTHSGGVAAIPDHMIKTCARRGNSFFLPPDQIVFLVASDAVVGDRVR